MLIGDSALKATFMETVRKLSRNIISVCLPVQARMIASVALIDLQFATVRGGSELAKRSAGNSKGLCRQQVTQVCAASIRMRQKGK